MSDDPLDLEFDLSEVSTEMPRLVAADYLFGIKSTEIKPNKAGTGKNLVVQFTLKEEGESLDGEVIKPGYPMSKYYALQQSENENAPDFRRDIAVLIDAAFKLGKDDERPAFNAETRAQMVGEEVLLKLKVVESDEYGTQNEITRVLAVDA